MGLFSTHALLAAAGPYAVAGVFLILALESALPIGFVLPGDTLLITAGLACATGHLSLAWILAAAPLGAAIGAHLGYLLGHAGTRALTGGRSSRVRHAVTRFEQVASRRGYGPALVAARFIPVARSIAGPASGLARIRLSRFTGWQVGGALAWTSSAVLAGYAVGRADPGLERYLPLFLLLAALSFPITAALGYLALRVRGRRRSTHAPPAAARDSDREPAAR